TGELRLCNYCVRTVHEYLPGGGGGGEGGEGSSNGIPIKESPQGTRRKSIVPIATVSAGSLNWSETATQSWEQSRLASKTQALNVADLCHLQGGGARREEERRNSHAEVSTGEEEESGPDWVREMDMTKGARESWNVGVNRNNDEKEKEKNGDEERIPTLAPLSPSKRGDTVVGGLELDREYKPRKVEGDDTEKEFERKAERLLDYLFKREGISRERWRDIVWSTSRSMASTVVVDVRRRKDAMNILNYVHIKKLCTPEDVVHAEVVQGVVCSQSVTHCDGMTEMRDASVMLVAGSIEYERGPGRLATLEPILAQEGQFLAKQVERILSRRPSVLLVEKGASRTAVELLHKAGVRTVVNVKEGVLMRVARSTGADVLPSSDAQLIQQNIGFAPVFAQRLVRLRGGARKSLVILDECPPDRGCSILLYSRSRKELIAVKKMLQTMILLLYSMDLERAYLKLFNVRLEYRCSACEVCETRRRNIDHDGEKSGLEKALDSSVLSISPFIDVEPPFLETSKGRSCSLLEYFKQPLYPFVSDEEIVVRRIEEEQEEQKEEDTSRLPSLPRTDFALSTGVNGDEDMAYFRAKGGVMFRERIKKRNEQSPKSTAPSSPRNRRSDVLDPLSHQRVAVLFGSFSPKSPNSPFFCVRPWVVSMHFYGANDMTLGEFLTKFCFSREYACPSSNCELPMLEHSRKLVCARICVEVTTQLMTPTSSSSSSLDTMEDIMAWHYCPSCKASSPMVALDDRVWHLSLGKMLDYLSHSSFSLGCVSSPAATASCQHCFFHEHHHFFSHANFVTTFKVTMIRPFDVHFSPVLCRIDPSLVSLQSIIDRVNRMAALANEMKTTAEERLKEGRELISQFNSSAVTSLEALFAKTNHIINDRLKIVEELTGGQDPMPTNAALALKAEEAVMVIREAAFSLLSQWNSESANLAALSRTLKKNADETGVPPPLKELFLDRLDDPFPSCLHLGLPLPSRAPVVVRDLQDSRGIKPDVASILAYALASLNYEECRRKAREAAGGEEQVLNLNASSMNGDENAMNAEHFDIEFSDSTTSYYVKTYYAERFHLLRRLLLPEGETAFIQSLSQAYIWTPQGGKSGSSFFRTCDGRFVIKTMSRFEVQSFVKFAPNYFDYLKTAVTEKKLTALCKVYGVFRVCYKFKNGTQAKMDVLVMEYLFYKHNHTQTWDLKGSLRNRMASTGKNSSDLVLLDENLMKDLWNNQLYVLPHSKAALNQAISNDSHFLSSQHIMDYSLLVGVDPESGQLVLGIVDYMRTYTLDKKLESWVKIVAIPGAHLPTILSPQMYCTRFSEAIDSYFPVVPDQWTGLGSVVSY
ncbi:ppk-3, partial [Pristionchus pacificus]|uniref:1-phosphatidylinositol-3-phosphate 5-kinase n=1 Tax=Pristionchus pacificus TaxID=54126 RepID=A0A8R1Z809_PRIPA